LQEYEGKPKLKKANLGKKIYPYGKTISQIFSTADIYGFIAVNTGFRLMISNRNHTKYFLEMNLYNGIGGIGNRRGI
jgi:hypothetical protein